jgi:hypothetical protein
MILPVLPMSIASRWLGRILGRLGQASAGRLGQASAWRLGRAPAGASAVHRRRLGRATAGG